MPESNHHSEFVGVEGIIKAQRDQLALFEEWADEGNWLNFHYSHYDWWMFPVNRRSSYGYKWTVYQREINNLKNNSEFVKNYL